MTKQVKIIAICKESDEDKVNAFLKRIPHGYLSDIQCNREYVMIVYDDSMGLLNNCHIKQK